MNVHGDLRHTENYESQANLTPEQLLWSSSWNLLRRLQSGRGQLRFNFAGLAPASKRVAALLGKEFVSADDVTCVTMVPMQANRSTRYHKENRPVRLQVTTARFHRDTEGHPAAGGEPSQVVFEADAAKHPTQDHPMIRVVDYDPRRGEVEERYGLELFGQQLGDEQTFDVVAPAAGIVVSDTEIVDGWLVYLLDGLPIYRFPVAHAEQITAVAEEGSIVEAGDVLVRLSGKFAFIYHRTTYTKNKPDLDDHRVLSPLHGDTSVQVDDLYANVFVTSGRETTLVARFHADDVASGKVELLPEREIRGTGKFERIRSIAPPINRIRLRVGEDWTRLVSGSETGEEYMIARLTSPVEYGLAELHKTGKAVWDHVNFGHDIIPASRSECKMAFRLVGKMLAMGYRLLFHKPGDAKYPQLRPVDDNWPTPYAVFSKSRLERIGFQKDFQWGPELKAAVLDAVSPRGDFAIRFNKGKPDEDWKLVECDNDVSPDTVMLHFEHDEETATMAVPASAAFHKQILESDQFRCSSPIADWVPRQFYDFEELQERLGNNLGWLLNEFLQYVAVEQDNGSYLLPESYVSCIAQQDHGLVLKLGTDNKIEDGVILLSPLCWDGAKRANVSSPFTWSVNGIFYDMTPPHLLARGARSTAEKQQRSKHRQRNRKEA